MVEVYKEMINRFMLASKLGMQYGGDRDIYQALGYPTEITFRDFYTRYARQDIAKSIINRPVSATWKGTLSVNCESEKFIKGWEDLEQRLKLRAKFNRADRLTSIGRFGCLMLGFSDVKDVDVDMRTPVQAKELSLDYIVPLSEGSVTIEEYVKDATDERFGLPRTYKVSLQTADKKERFILVHHSRMIHITGELLDSEVYGVPVLEPIWNRLIDLEKLVGGSAEMYWKGARPGYSGKVDANFTPSQDLKDEVKGQMEEYEHGLRRFLVTKGVEFESLAQQIADPTNHVEVQIQMISAVTGIPKRILTGSERGELASSQDKITWDTMITARREDFAEPQIVRPFIDRLIKVGILEKQDYEVEWQSLFMVSDKDKADVGRIRATALKEYSTHYEAKELIPPEIFYKHFLGFTDTEIEEIEGFVEKQIKEDV